MQTNAGGSGGGGIAEAELAATPEVRPPVARANRKTRTAMREEPNPNSKESHPPTISSCFRRRRLLPAKSWYVHFLWGRISGVS